MVYMTEQKTIDKTTLLNAIDQSGLRQNFTNETIKKEALISKEYGFRGYVVHPCNLQAVVNIVKGSKVLPVVVTDFPHGRSLTSCRINETKEVIKLGAEEVDIVAKYQQLIDGDLKEYKNDLLEVTKTTTDSNKLLKVILEIDLLNEELIKNATNIICEIATEVKGSKLCVKTKTGFAENIYSNFDAVKTIKNTLETNGLYGKNKIVIKASGGMKTKEDAIKMLETGAHILGTSSGVQIVS